MARHPHAGGGAKGLAAADYRHLVDWAKHEDLGPGDITSEATILADATGRAAIVFREVGVLCGMPVVGTALQAYDAELRLEKAKTDGSAMKAGQTAGVVSGPLRSILAAERVLLNFLQRLSGIATVTRQFVDAVAGTKAQICDTRKTTPGWRLLEKYAVRCGGGSNHRVGLFDAVLIKDNHLAGLDEPSLREGVEEAIERISNRPAPPAFIEVEVDTLEQFEEILPIPGIDMILLDNMDVAELRQAVRRRDEAYPAGGLLLEASGNIKLTNVRSIAETGVDRISVGALTHSVRAVNIGLDLE